ncbi:hypothetical protein E2C01_100620 [Portunus trituberculatus]|uniref:Uncharacterized protein n=1 Tax=Portunus trituberculatus TaxID=210409 RepID=A0A5B7KI18_PORTR|nr:hypothetical protein [Portunus trituberculatus]
MNPACPSPLPASPRFLMRYSLIVLTLSSDEKVTEVPGRVVQVRPDTVTWSCRLAPTPGK